MIIGVGTDIVDVRRIEKLLKKQGVKFQSRVFTNYEREEGKKKTGNQLARFFAKRWAAKEALSKALGVGIGEKLSFLDMEVYNHTNGKPAILLNEKAKKLVGENTKIDLSLSDEYPYAMAFVVISK